MTSRKRRLQLRKQRRAAAEKRRIGRRSYGPYSGKGRFDGVTLPFVLRHDPDFYENLELSEDPLRPLREAVALAESMGFRFVLVP